MKECLERGRNEPQAAPRMIEPVEMVRIPAGPFLFGSNHGSDFAKPARKAHLEEFYIDPTPVTLEQFRVFLRDTNYETEGKRAGYSYGFVRSSNGDTEYEKIAGLCLETYLQLNLQPDLPAFYVSHQDACMFASWIGKSLPSEAQLEKATKGPVHSMDDVKFWWGDSSPKGRCNYRNEVEDFFSLNGQEIGIPPVTPVRMFPANGYGVHDSCGNVWRWCNDWFSPVTEAPTSSPQKQRARRCGAWNVNREFRLWCSNRGALHPHSWNSNTGFMCVV